MTDNKFKPNAQTIAVIGGGIAGSTAALHFAEQGLNVVLIEKGPDLVNGPPICHLHAGGNLYREITTEQCTELLRQSIDTVRLFPHTINRRPTVIATPVSDQGDPSQLIERLDTVKQCYAQLVNQDSANQVLGDVKDYYRLYNRDELESLANQRQPQHPVGYDQWMIPFAANTDLAKLKYPVVAVNEFGWSVFRLAATVTLTLNKLPNCQVMTSTELIAVTGGEGNWKLALRQPEGRHIQIDAQYLVNACGYRTGLLDDQLQKPRQRLVEFKAAYVTRWAECKQHWPEVIFHGERGTPNGMAQLTPYTDGVFQLHGMTESITLFEDGLVVSDNASSQPKLPIRLQSKLDTGWPLESAKLRTMRAIEHISQYIPNYFSSSYYGLPLYGAQQIPGVDKTLRAADVSFAGDHYARLEIVKGSSALESAQKIAAQWQLGQQDNVSIEQAHPVTQGLDATVIENLAKQLASQRGYPEELAARFGE